MNFKKYIFPVLIIFSITVLGYALHFTNNYKIEETPICETAQEKPDYRKEIEGYLDTFLVSMQQRFDESYAIGGAIAVVYKGQVVILEPYGVKKVNTTDSVNIHTVFRLASVSKGFAGVLAAKLSEDQILNLDSTVISYLPDFKLKRADNQEHLTLRHVLSQSTGIVAHSFDPSIEDGVPYNTIYNELYKANIIAKPGRIYTYQNAVFSLIDTIVYAKTGKPYQQILHDSIFKPLGMDDASVYFEDFTACDNYAFPHKYRRRNYRTIPLNDRYYNVPAAAGVNASIADMSKWLQALLGHRDTIISHKVLRTISDPQVKTPVKYINRRNWGKIDSKEYGLGWRIIDWHDNIIMYHGGFVEGYRAEIAFCTDKQIGIVFLTNSPNRIASEVVPYFMQGFFDYTDSIQNSNKQKQQSLLASK